MNEITPAVVREELDTILAKEITSFVDMGSDTIKVTYNLATISCIFTIVDREKEIEAFHEAPIERYTIGTLLDELGDIGLVRDENLRRSVDAVIRNGYATTDKDGHLIASLASFTMVGFLNNMFPGMPGMNLIAFVIQINEEVNSQRKGLEEAKTAFAQTLKQRGVAVTKEKIKENITVAPEKKDFTAAKKVTTKLKKDNLNRLSRFVKKKKTGSASNGTGGKLKIRDVFDKGPSVEEVDKKKSELENAEKALREAEQKAKEYAATEEHAKEAQLALQDAEKKVLELEARVKELKDIETAALEAEKKEEELTEREAEMALKEAELQAMEKRLQDQEEQRIKLEEKAVEEKESQKKLSRGDDDIEAQITALETDLAMRCPLCDHGKVVENTTEKGKQYFSCNDEECRFVSWDKPYHFPCPLCKNPYLIEFETAAEEKGLKCPRASCTYEQKNLLDPAQNMAAASVVGNNIKKKKKRVVRRVRRR